MQFFSAPLEKSNVEYRVSDMNSVATFIEVVKVVNDAPCRCFMWLVE
ncbi:hypothetical protein XBKQ1_2630051 [Xenorhabdus bovienii str. kraussei Quebec]|uniref:Uncharacterized protein n=2 Tax=Xenorhabdus bovienii TaxID=40576 RepID=A0A077PH93_XENBV|nr:hypothetical protein XBKQ1_2630051 [Xenorhabdus bovienii str. kraussei Quebec]CDH32480.1 hypothetical protein XBI1_1940111 [Xenorhabdus bovienii str. Intermedium]